MNTLGFTVEQRRELQEKQMRTRAANGTMAPNHRHGSWKAAGWREIGIQRCYFRSRWEANFGRYLEWLRCQKQIREWHHEPKTFWFEGIKRGAVSYLPDFLVVENDGRETYYEVKGWMDDRSRVKIERMARYHPTTKLIVIDSVAYRKLAKQIERLVPDWEHNVSDPASRKEPPASRCKRTRTPR